MLLLLASLAFGATDPDPRWTVTVDPLTTALGFVHVQTEYVPSSHLTVYAGPSLRLFSTPGTKAEPYRGYGGEAGVRWFPRGHAPNGPWLMARGVLAHLRADTGQTTLGGYTSALIGTTWTQPGEGPRLVLSGGLGVQRLDYDVGPYGIHGILPAAHTNIGVGF